MYWVFFLVGLAVIGVFALAAIGALGELNADDSLHTDSNYEPGQRIPFQLFGYQKQRVDAIISQLQTEKVTLEKKKK